MNQVLRFLAFAVCFLILHKGYAQPGNCGDGTSINLSNGRTQVYTCAGDKKPDVLNFRTGLFYIPFALLVTDEKYNILEVTLDLKIDFERYAPGDYRVLAVYYKGILFAKPGMNAVKDTLASYCYGLTGNFVTVNHIIPEGGTVQFNDGSTTKYLCPDDGKPDVVSVKTTSRSSNYHYVLTDERNVIVQLLEGSTFDFEKSPEGVNRIWGYTYGGDLIAKIGQPLTTGISGTGCFELSSNFVEIVKTRASGGTVSLATGGTLYRTCSNDPTGGRADLRSQTTSRALYAFVLTDINNRIIRGINGNNVGFGDLQAGEYRVWGISYTGTLKLPVNQVLSTVTLSDECFDLSKNFITVNILPLNAGRISLANGDTSTVVCLNEPNALLRTFRSSGAVGGSYAFVVTNADNTILAFSSTGVINFGGLTGITNKVWGFAYYGGLRAKTGDNLFQAVLADSCFLITTRSVTVTKKSPFGGKVNFADGTTSRLLCFGNTAPSAQKVTTTGGNGENYIYLLADRQNNVLTISQDGAFNLDANEAGEYRIYGLSYTGRLAFPSGANISSTRFSDQCFELSSNFITLTKVRVNGGQVRLSGNRQEIKLCQPVAADTMLTMTNSSILQQNYIYLLTNTSNTIIALSAKNQVLLPAALEGNFRIWGLAYSGNLQAKVGDLATNTSLSSQCWELSDNFVTVTKKTVQGGVIRLPAGVSPLICFGQNAPESINIQVTGAVNTNYNLVVTDTFNRIITNINGTTFRPARSFPARIRIWGLSYSGNLTAIAGNIINTSALSSECFDLSDNFITLSLNEVDGGALTFSTGETQRLVCIDAVPDVLSFRNTGTTKSAYRYLLTDAQNRILLILIGNSADFNVAAPGIYRIWGLSFSGNLTAKAGDIVGNKALSDACYDLSDSFLTIIEEQVKGGTINFDNNQSTKIVCNTGLPDVVTYQSQGAAAGPFTYVFTDARNRVLGSSTASTFNFETINEDTIRIWGLSYTGSLNLTTGGNVTTSVLSSACYSLSTNFGTLLRVPFQGGLVRVSTGGVRLTQCPGESGTVRFLRGLGVGTAFVYLVTDTTNKIIAITPADTFSFRSFPSGNFRVWSLAYGGQLLAKVGQNAALDKLSDDCWVLSQNFITIQRQIPKGGQISAENIGTQVITCPKNGRPDNLFLLIKGSDQGQIGYVLTDTNNVIRRIVQNPVFDFDTIAPGRYRIWGLVFNGELLPNTAGSSAFVAALSSSCFALTSNFVDVINFVPRAGSIQSSTLPASFCSGDGVADVVTLNLVGATPNRKAFLVTSEKDELLFAAQDTNKINLDKIPGRNNIRIYGLVYTGVLNLANGASIKDRILSSDCFSLTDNFVVVSRTSIDGAKVFTEFPGDSVYVCPGDGKDDIIAFFNTSLSAEAGYRYVITNTSNQVLSIINGIRQSFENVGFKELRVWGVSFSGNFRLSSGQTITNATASDGCWNLSDNFITILRDVPDGGKISTLAGETELKYCLRRGETKLELKTTSKSKAGFAYILTDVNGIVVQISRNSKIDFGPQPEGRYIITGVSYTGRLRAEVGKVFPADSLATNCFDVADNSIRVERGTIVDGGRLSTPEGDSIFYTCPGDTISDVVTVFSPEQTISAAYRILITDAQNRILFPDVQSALIDFGRSAPGAYRIWGISFNGEYTAQFGANIFTSALSTECFDLSANYITVVAEAAKGGTVATRSGQTSVNTVKGDNKADFVRFVHPNSSKNIPYNYLITDNQNTIKYIVAIDSFDFEKVPVGSYRVWGLSYTGKLTAQVGQSAELGALADNCFALSSNFIRITVANAVNGGEEIQAAATPIVAVTTKPFLTGEVELKAAPNPAVSEVLVSFNWQIAEHGAAAELLLYHATGALVKRIPLQMTEGENQVRMEIADITPGWYLLRLQNASTQGVLKLLKIQY
jgi:hypothetical protein